AAPLLRITPNLLPAVPVPPPGGRFVLRTGARVARPVLVAVQGGRVLGSTALPATALPDRSLHLYGPLLTATATAAAGPVDLTVRPAPGT
ncbi:oxidoreductase, partial [Streptomyces zhihengii]